MNMVHINGAMLQAIEAEDRAGFEAALSAYKRLAAKSGFRNDGLAKDFGILRTAAPEVAQALAPQGRKGLAWLKRLAGDEMIDLRCLACLVVGEIGRGRPHDVVVLAHRLAADDNWVVREIIANGLDDGLGPAQGDFLFDLMTRWARDPDANVRRVPTNALMRYGRHNPEEVVGLMRTLLRDDSGYVRKNVAFCLGIMGLAYHPTLGVKAPERPRWLAGLLRKWTAESDERARWIIAETLGRTWAKKCPAEALGVMRLLAADQRKRVRRQVVASLKSIAGHSPAEVRAVLKSWSHVADENVQALAREILRKGGL